MIVPYTLQLPGCTRLCLEPYAVATFRLAVAEPPSDDAKRIDAYLEQALNLPPDARRAFLDRLGQEEPALRQILDTLLEGIDEEIPPGFLRPLPNMRSILNRIHRKIQDPPENR
ncbi:MAG: hypothetical protein SH809_02010 [Rhodothermales bacterium]|nr:hypothetical protein [Rhodothermales bacterium]